MFFERALAAQSYIAGLIAVSEQSAPPHVRYMRLFARVFFIALAIAVRCPFLPCRLQYVCVQVYGFCVLGSVRLYVRADVVCIPMRAPAVRVERGRMARRLFSGAASVFEEWIPQSRSSRSRYPWPTSPPTKARERPRMANKMSRRQPRRWSPWP